MRGGWLLPLAGLLISIVAIGAPFSAGIARFIEGDPGAAARTVPGSIVATTLLWSAALAAAATLIGWLPGRVIGRGRSVVLAAFTLAPVCLPPYLVFTCW